jgi:MFS family permease
MLRLGAGVPISNTARRFFYGYVIVFAGFIILITMFTTRYGFGVFFKPVQNELGWTRAQVAGAFSLSMLLEGLIGIVMGGLNDKAGPRMVLTLCGLLLGLGCLLMSKVHSIWQLYLFFGIIMGTGMSGAWVPLTSTIARWFVKRRGIWSGFVLTGAGVAGLIAPPLANLLIAHFEWRRAFMILGIGVLMIILPVAQLLRRDPSKMGLAPDGADIEGKRGSESGDGDGASPREAFYTRQFWLVMALFFSFGACMFTALIHIVPHATDLRISGATAAKILAALGGLAIIGRLFLGNLCDRIGSCRVFIIGFILMPAAYVWLMFSHEAWMLYLFAVPFGLAQGGMGSAESLLVVDLFGLKSHGLIYGVTGFGFTLGGAAGPWLAGYLYDVTNSYGPAFLACAVLGIIGLVLAALILRLERRR